MAANKTYILGISAYYHDSAAALICDGKIVAAAQEERFTRKKHDAKFPSNAVLFCLKQANITLTEISYIAFYDKPLVKFERLLETYLAFAPRGFTSFVAAMPVWLNEKLFLKTNLKKEFSKIANIKKTQVPPILFSEHHQSHAASAFFPSPYQEAAVICLDGVGEWATSSVWHGKDNQIIPQWEMQFPHSLGLLYSAFTYFCGFKVNSGEYKLMGLAPYGEPKYVKQILEHLIDLKEDGTFRLNMKYFSFATGLKMTSGKFNDLFGGPPRKPEDLVTVREMDLARSIQEVTEEVVLRLAKTVHKELKTEAVCLAGGVALNCVANGRLLREGPFKNIWIQPAAGDAGGALGTALAVWHQYLNQPRIAQSDDSMLGTYLGPSVSSQEVKLELDRLGASYASYSEDKFYILVAEILAQENVVGWFQGRMEFGPRALGARSILGDPRSQKMQSIMNLKIKYRESFRPFAPAVLEEDVANYFDMKTRSPYMLLVAGVKDDLRIPMSADQEKLFGIEKLNIARSTLPAITHVDYSARIQTVSKKTNPKFHNLLAAFKQKTGCGVLINTSFNVRGEPIVCSVEDAFRCFMRTEMDYLIVDNYILSKKDQKPLADDKTWQKEFELD